MNSRRTVPRLMLISDRHSSRFPLPELARLAVQGGVGAIQVRERDLSSGALEALVRDVQGEVPDDVAVIVNTNATVAHRTGAGLHLPELEPCTGFQEELTRDALLGRSVHSAEAAAAAAGYDYLIAGHVFATASKPRMPPIGTEGLARIVAATPLPVLAIGGITPQNLGAAMSAGAYGIAVMSGIGSAEDPASAARRYADAIDAYDEESTRMNEDTINATVNGKPAELPPGMTIAEFLRERGQHERLVVVERNGTILRKGELASTVIEQGDVLEIVHFVGGGQRASSGNQR